MNQGAQLFVIGLGPGDAHLLTAQARACLAASQTIVGYGVYVDLVPDELRQGKRLLVSGMTREIERVHGAIDAVCAGETSSLVCSGDAGIYALAGLVFELLAQRGLLESVAVEVIAGVPAVCAAAALLGAPLMHDFVCISLSDLLTPWILIQKRLHAAFDADFVTVLYNPRSKKRLQQLETALEIARQYRNADTPVGIVRQAFRPQQEVRVVPLQSVNCTEVDMLTLLIIGNSSTQILGKWMVTPRGYLKKYKETGMKAE